MSEIPMLTAHKTPLSFQAGWLIQQGMFDADGGRFSGLLAIYKDALNGLDIEVSYVLFPHVGLAILVDGQFSLYVHKKHRGNGVATELTKEFIERFPRLLLSNKIQSQFPTTKIVNKILKLKCGA